MNLQHCSHSLPQIQDPPLIWKEDVSHLLSDQQISLVHPFSFTSEVLCCTTKHNAPGCHKNIPRWLRRWVSIGVIHTCSDLFMPYGYEIWQGWSTEILDGVFGSMRSIIIDEVKMRDAHENKEGGNENKKYSQVMGPSLDDCIIPEFQLILCQTLKKSLGIYTFCL